MTAIALAIVIFAIVSSELLPISLLMQMARYVGISEGPAGQTLTLTVHFVSLAVPVAVLAIECLVRRLIMSDVCLMLIASNMPSAFRAPLPT
ncbi:hypothetical protein [Nitratireductor thuwali]|uniref:hypothetical protein n=1 Tax=Nitratireductor thuwali TaxID=2267699 RepID=UPI0030CAE81B